MMENVLDFIIVIFSSVLASTGLWTFINERFRKKDNNSVMLLGLAHDRVITLGMTYLDRGWITSDEYENLHDYLYLPYVKLGGNGLAKRIMNDIDKLPIKDNITKIGGIK